MVFVRNSISGSMMKSRTAHSRATSSLEQARRFRVKFPSCTSSRRAPAPIAGMERRGGKAWLKRSRAFPCSRVPGNTS